MQLVVESVLFAAFSDSTVVDPEGAAAVMEEVTATLKRLTPEERGAFEDYVRLRAAEERDPARAQRIAAIVDDLGLRH